MSSIIPLHKRTEFGLRARYRLLSHFRQHIHLINKGWEFLSEHDIEMLEAEMKAIYEELTCRGLTKESRHG